jgi:hypothetical protein
MIAAGPRSIGKISKEIAPRTMANIENVLD